MKVQQAEGEIRKDVLNTEAQQKTLRNAMNSEFQNMKKDMARAVEDVKQTEK